MERLTKELHDKLVASGYQFLMIKDVRKVEGTTTYHHIVQPIRQLPATPFHGCTGINDEMILSTLENPAGHIELYIEKTSVFWI